MSSVLKEKYEKEVVPKLRKEFGIENPMAVPRLRKVVLNMGVGDAISNIKVLDTCVEQLQAIAGQKVVVRRARKSIATFKLREGMPIGATVTLRRERMYEFLERLIHVALPRVRDFRGIPSKSFDGRGNYSIGVRDFLIFPEADYNKADKTRGMNITIVTNCGSDEQSRFLLKELGMPFGR